jgi:coatomer protein complex subunit gamma
MVRPCPFWSLLSCEYSNVRFSHTARLFNSSPISPRRCRTLLTKIAVLLFTGEKFPTNEATTLFFGISKLFQNKDPSLRQMVYLILKELANTAEDVIMSTSIIMKDTAVGSDVLYRANAIRALCRIIDVCARYIILSSGPSNRRMAGYNRPGH